MKYKLSDICTVSSSKRIYASEYVSSGIPFYRSKEIIKKAKGINMIPSKYISKKKFDRLNKKYGVPQVNDILVTSVGTIGVPYLVTKSDLPFYFKDGNLIKLSKWNTRKINPKYVFYWLKSYEGQNAIKRIMIGSTQKALTIHSLSQIVVNLPRLDIQNKIANILYSIDNKIILNKQINNNLLSILNLYFIKIFDTSFRRNNSEKIVKLDDVAHNIKKRARAGHLIYKPYIPINKIPKRQLFSSNYENNSKARSSLVYFNNNDILFGAMRPYFHRLMIAPFNGVTRSTTIIIRANNAEVQPFLAVRLFQNDFIKYAYSNCKGSTMPYDTWNTIKNFKFYMPSHLNKFNNIFNLIKSYAYNLNSENIKLSQLSYELLFKFFN